MEQFEYLFGCSLLPCIDHQIDGRGKVRQKIAQTRMHGLLKTYTRHEKMPKKRKEKMPTTSSVPRRSPIQVLTRLNVA